MIAYDFETTRIQPGTPRPLYLTAFNAEREFSLETPIKDMAHLLWVLETYFLTSENHGVKFVAWHGNNFDAYLICAALVTSGKYILRPYMTRSKALRGLRVLPVGSDLSTRSKQFWEFTDGAAMLGLAQMTLDKFLKNFAPDFPKLSGAVNFETEEFDPNNKAHCDYAMRDSVGLWWGMHRAQKILLDTFNQPLSVTMGAACIKIFCANIPRGVEVPLPRDEILTVVREYVMRGGFCYCVKRYKGPVWKYDINQAYAAAMRDASLPCGFTSHTKGKPPGNAEVYIARIKARNMNNRVPFYYRANVDGRVKSLWAQTEIADTWLTSIEIKQLQKERWQIDWIECYAWGGVFSMYEYVSQLETLRRTCEGGPSGPAGTMVKGVGNHSYGKTVEQTEPLEFVVADECPPEYAPFYGDGTDPMDHVYYRFVPEDEQRAKAYHQPQIGAFITAHVRMFLRQTILLSPSDWIYADTDCVVFTRDVTALLDIDSTRYGAWKIEEAGSEFMFIAKKVYAATSREAKKYSSKGLNVKLLKHEDFEMWYEGEPPEQEQTQRQNFLKVMQGAEMFKHQLRKGTRVEAQT